MSSAKKPAHITMLLLSQLTGKFKIRTLEDASIIAIPSKQGKVDNTPTHRHNLDIK